MKTQVIYDTVTGKVTRYTRGGNTLSLRPGESSIEVDERIKSLEYTVAGGQLQPILEAQWDKNSRWSIFSKAIPSAIFYRVVLKSLYVLFINTGATPPDELIKIKQKYDEIFS